MKVSKYQKHFNEDYKFSLGTFKYIFSFFIYTFIYLKNICLSTRLKVLKFSSNSSLIVKFWRYRIHFLETELNHYSISCKPNSLKVLSNTNLLTFTCICCDIFLPCCRTIFQNHQNTAADVKRLKLSQ